MAEGTERRAAGADPETRSDRQSADPVADSVAARMGAQLFQIGSGAAEWPVTISSVTAGWAQAKGGNVAGPTVCATTDRVC